MLFLQLAALQLCVVSYYAQGTQCDPYWKTPTAHFYWEQPSLPSTLYTEFVGLCTWLSSFHMHVSFQGTVSATMIRVLGSRWLDYDVRSERRLDDVWKLQFLTQVCLECPVACLLEDALLLCVAEQRLTYCDILSIL